MINFKRVIEVTIDKTKFISKDFFIDLFVEKDDKQNVNTAEVIIFNLKESTIVNIKQGQTVMISAGYSTPTPLFIGGVGRVEVDYENADKAISIFCIDGKVAIDKQISKTYCGKITAEQIIHDLIKESGLEANIIKINKNIIYSNGKVIFGDLLTELFKVIKDTGSKSYIKNNILTINTKTSGKELAFLINANTGLLSPPTKLEGDKIKYVIKTLLNGNLDVDSIVKIKSRTLNGAFRINKIKHICGLVDECITEFEVTVDE